MLNKVSKILLIRKKLLEKKIAISRGNCEIKDIDALELPIQNAVHDLVREKLGKRA